jgi:hypothetical protein
MVGGVTVRALVVADAATARALAARIDAAHGLPRCERLAGRATFLGGAARTCPCTDVAAPDARCPHAARTELAPTRLRDGSIVVPVRESQAATIAALTAAERLAVVTIAESAKVRAIDVVAPIAGVAR